MNSFFTWHIFLEVGKTQDLPSKIWQTLGDEVVFVLVLVRLTKIYFTFPHQIPPHRGTLLS
jgi:hypothetical protein